MGEAGRPYAAPGGVGGNQGRGVLGRGRGCGSCQVATTWPLCEWASPGKLVRLWQNMGHRCGQATWACSVVLASGAERGQCPGSRVHYSSSYFWPRMHQLSSSPSIGSLTTGPLTFLQVWRVQGRVCNMFWLPSTLPDRFPAKMSEILHLHPFAQKIAAHHFNS